MRPAPALAIALLFAQPAAALTYQPMSLGDLKLDQAKLMDKKVNVTGLYHVLGDMSVLAKEDFDPSPFWVATRNLPRDQRKQLLDCENKDCKVMVWGYVSHGIMGYVLVAERIQVLGMGN